jgi:predicted ATPase
VLLSGEPGIGKSRLVRALRERLAPEPHTPLSHFCSPFHQTSALYPVIDLLERASGFARDDDPPGKLAKLEALLAHATADVAGTAPLVAALLSIPNDGRYPPLGLSPQRQKERTLEALVDQLAGLAKQQPVLAVYEDVHWADPTTLKLLDRVVDRVQALPALVLVTFRPEFAPRWTGRGHVTPLTLSRLGRREGAALVGRVAGGKALPAEVLEQIMAKTDGVPLFVEELTKTVLEAGLLKDVGDRYELAGTLPPLAIPSTLHDSLLARLDRLAPVRQVAQIGACIGRVFGHELLAAVVPLREDQLRNALAQLCRSELVFRRGTAPEATYAFKHALVQDAAHESLLKSRRQGIHTRITRVLEERFPEVVGAEPELLARHCAEAGLLEQAVDYWYRAGRQSLARSAMNEAVEQLKRGLDLLETLPDTPEGRHRKLRIEVGLGAALSAARGPGAPETARAYARAHELCAGVGADPNVLPALQGRFSVHFQRAELAVGLEVARELLHRAEEWGAAIAQVIGHRLAGAALYHLGEFPEGRAHLETGLALYDPARDRAAAVDYAIDARVICSSWLAHSLLVLGYPEQALARIGEALAWADALAHPNSVAHALMVACIFHGRLGPGREARATAERLVAYATEQGFAGPAAVGTVVAGWALAGGEPIEEGLARTARGLEEYRATGGELWVPDFLALLAQMHGWAGQPAAGLDLVAELWIAPGGPGDAT